MLFFQSFSLLLSPLIPVINLFLSLFPPVYLLLICFSLPSSCLSPLHLLLISIRLFFIILHEVFSLHSFLGFLDYLPYFLYSYLPFFPKFLNLLFPSFSGLIPFLPLPSLYLESLNPTLPHFLIFHNYFLLRKHTIYLNPMT